MAYEKVKDGIIKDISTRKEFYSLKLHKSKDFNISGIVDSYKFKHLSDNIIPRFILENEIKKGNFLRLHSYQIFIKNFINPCTPYNKLLIKWETGTGKTIAAISMAMSFINQYREESKRGLLNIGSVFIIGFTKQIFKNELIKFPELGFISREEIGRLKQLTKLISRGTRVDINHLKDFIVKIRKRFSNRKYNGFFKFYGYKEFVNKIFLPRGRNINISLMTEEEILESLKIGKIKFNEELLESFNNSLIICDEIHNVYNSADKNNWGIAIQSVLDNVPTVRAVFLSATPINNSPTEVVDLLNLLLPSDIKLNREDLFSDIKASILKPDALDKIKKYTMGRISFVKDINPLYFPSKIYIGDKISGIDYLRFTRCPMSPFHYKTYKAVYRGILSQDNQYLVDFALPDPKYGISGKNTAEIGKNSKDEEEEIGMFQTKQIKNALINAPQEWKDTVGLDWENNMIIGDALEKDTLKKYSNKFYKMVLHVQNSIKLREGKLFIYSNIVHISGVLFIQEVLKKNGIIMLGSTPTGHTLCVYDGLTLDEHIKQKIKDHEFTPARFISIHSEIDKISINRQIQRFNDPNNAEGNDIMILVGSKIIKESYDIKAIQNVYIMGRPNNIPTLIQIIGRSIRKNSHENLPANRRCVKIRIFTSCLPVTQNKKSDKKSKKESNRLEESSSASHWKLSYEEIKYREKIKIFKIIQRIEKKFHEGSIDMPINVRLMFNDKGKFKSNDPLGPLDFTPDYQIPKSFSLADMITSTFEAFYEETEMNAIISIIKRLFIEEDVVWTYDQLFRAVKSPPDKWELNINTLVFNEWNFQVALMKLVWSSAKKSVEPLIIPEHYRLSANNPDKNIHDDVIEMMDDRNNKMILLPNGQLSVIMKIRKYYCLMPLDRKILEPIIDVEMPYRLVSEKLNRNVNIKSYLESLSPMQDYSIKKNKFKQKYQYVELINMENAVCDYGVNFHQIFLEEIIKYIFNLLTGRVKMFKKDLHEFYFKMLYYYDVLGIVIWASTAKDFMGEKYAEYTSESIPIRDIVEQEKKEDIQIAHRTNILRELEASISTAGCNWCPIPIQEQYYVSLSRSLKLINSVKGEKIPANMLPIGHFIKNIPRFFDPKSVDVEWNDVPSYLNKISKKWEENNLIIGFDEKSKNGIHIRFKIRSPMQDIEKFQDIRKIEKGSVCTSKSKGFLLQLINVLNIDLPKKFNVVKLCDMIRTKLIFNEIKERNEPNSNLKYFYMYFEKQPLF